MFENHVMQMFDTRELEMRSRLSQRRVDLVPPLRGYRIVWPATLVGALRRLLGRPQTRTTPSTSPSLPCL